MQLADKYIELLGDHQIPATLLFDVFNRAALQAGINYFEQQQVVGYHVSKDGSGNLEIVAQVQGSAAKPYETRVRFNAYNPKWITSRCSCPVVMGCKHGVAALLRYLTDTRHSARQEAGRRQGRVPAYLAATLPTASHRRSPVDIWLHSLANANASPLFQAEESSQPVAHLVYLLHTDHAGMLQAGLYKATPLKRGGYSKLASIPYETLLTPYKERKFQYTAQDLLVAQLVADMELRHVYTHTNKCLPKGKKGEQVMEAILQTGRAYWATTETWGKGVPALRMGATKPCQVTWRNQPHADIDFYIVQLGGDPPIHAHFWLNGKLWYISQQLDECGLLYHPDLNLAQLEKLLQAPAIPAAEATKVSERLQSLLPDADIPLPVPVGEPPMPVHAPVQPDLLLCSIPLDGQADKLAVASLRFNYAGHVLQLAQAKPTHLVTEHGQRYRIHRDLAAEQAALDILLDYGFQKGDGFSTALQGLDCIMPPDLPPTLQMLRWHDFLEHGIPALQDGGWQVSFAPDFHLQFAEAEAWEATWEDKGNAWFELSLGFEVEGKRVNLLPLLVEMLGKMDSPQSLRALLQRQPYVFVPLEDGRWAKLDASRLGSILDTLIELYDHQPLNANGNLAFTRHQGLMLGELLSQPGLRWTGAEALQALVQRPQTVDGIQPVALPQGLQAELRPYQHHGVSWLQFLREFNLGGILADDMGLGKTLQTLAHLLLEKQAGRMDRPSLVVAPTSLMGNWRREAARFTPDLRVLVIHGNDRHQHFTALAEYDLLLTTYPLIVRDLERYHQQEFHYLILDEAQAIKNAAARTAQAVCSLRARHRLCLTGTPLENHLGELWSMFHFLMPGFLSTHERFARLFRTPIEKHADNGRQVQLRKRVQPFLLRRTKAEVAHELPPKTEILRSATLEGAQRDLYETVRLAMDQKVQETINRQGLARSHIMILDALLKLRQVCCDPRLLKLGKAQAVKESAKLELLMTLLPEMVEEGRKILLFSQFTSMLALIEEELVKAGIAYCKLTGQTKQRDKVVAQFQQGEVPVFLISLKAGGVGLNLTAADTVIHYDPWWNPAVEQQATDRAYRIGQDKPVFVYKLITEDTVEEKILKLQEKKQALADALYHGEGGGAASFTATDLAELFRPLG